MGQHGLVMGARLEKAPGWRWLICYFELVELFLSLICVVGQEVCEHLPVRGLQNGGDSSKGHHQAAGREQGCETAWQEGLKLLDVSVLKSSTC